MDGLFDVFEFETMITSQAFNRSIYALGTNKLYLYRKYSRWNKRKEWMDDLTCLNLKQWSSARHSIDLFTGTNKLYIYKKYSKWNKGNNSKKTNIHTKTDNHCTLLDSTVNNIYISSVILSINLIENCNSTRKMEGGSWGKKFSTIIMGSQ